MDETGLELQLHTYVQPSQGKVCFLKYSCAGGGEMCPKDIDKEMKSSGGFVETK